MSPLIETIRVYNGTPNNVAYHQRRMQRAFDALAGGAKAPDLAGELKKIIFPIQGLFKCRVIYHEVIEHIHLEPYVIRPVASLRLVKSDTIEYNHKFEDRRTLQKLFDQRNGCDDVLIVKQGLITDTLYANVIFRRGEEWLTPSAFLLAGTQRAFLLDRGIIREQKITPADLPRFSACKLINSMLLLEGPEIAVENIKTS